MLRPRLAAFLLPAHVDELRPRLAQWASLLLSRQADRHTETELLPDFLTLLFCNLLGYTRPADGGDAYSFSREQHVEIDGKFADAVLGHFPSAPDGSRASSPPLQGGAGGVASRGAPASPRKGGWPRRFPLC